MSDKDKIPTLAEAKKLIKKNGRTLAGTTRVIDITEFMSLFRSDGYKAMAESVLSMIDQARLGKVDMKQARIQFDGYKMLIELKILDQKEGMK